MNWQENVTLRDRTTFKIGGPARYFAEIKSEEDLLVVLNGAREADYPVFILGGGSNLLVSDKGFPGLVLHMAIDSVDWRDNRVEVGSGVALSWLVKESARRGLSGLEPEVAIPGTVGGAVCGNAGAPEKSIGQLVEEVRFFDREKFEFGSLPGRDCRFDYRSSLFRRNPRFIITSVVLEGSYEKKEIIRERLHETAFQKARAQPREHPSAGCVFCNPSGQSAGALIDRVGLKGRRIGEAQISEKHANFIVNLGRAKSVEVAELIELARHRVQEEFGVSLEEEIIRL